MKKIIHTPNAPAPIGPYSQAIETGNLLFVSGQVAIDPAGGNLVMGTLEEETHQVMKNISAILTEAGYSFNDLVKTTIFLSSMDLFTRVNEVYGSYFSANYPARETVAVAGLPKGVNVEISVTACRG
jgi:2-iminobutanoate/2-iminopropanoate deaminase